MQSPEMSSILRRSAGFARVTSRSLNISTRTSLRTPRLLRTTPAAWFAQPRFYSSSPQPPKPDRTPKDGDKSDSADKPRVQSTHSPGPAEAGTHNTSDQGNHVDSRCLRDGSTFPKSRLNLSDYSSNQCHSTTMRFSKD